MPQSPSTAPVEPYDGTPFEFSVQVIVVGAGGCGLSAALAAAEAGAEVLVIERDATPLGTTAMSSGLIPAAGTRAQRAANIEGDSEALFAADMLAKSKGKTDADMVRRLAAESTVTVDWMTETLGLPLTLVASAELPGHSRTRLHATPNRSGFELMSNLYQAALDRGIDILTKAVVETLIADPDGRVRGVRYRRPDDSLETVGCEALILASCGFAGNPALVQRYIPQIAHGVAHTHPGSQGDALLWGEGLGAATADLSGYQGHASLTVGHGLLIHWIAMAQGGLQLNLDGRRFADESRGYSEQAVDVLAQPGGVAWNIFDVRIHQHMQEFEEYRDAVSAGAIKPAADIEALARVTGMPLEALTRTLGDAVAAARGEREDGLGRDLTTKPPLSAPYVAVKVTGALFHTQGGLVVDRDARVMTADGRALPNLFAGGGAARGVSGPEPSGYLAGNGLLTATTLGRLAGQAAARLVTG